MESTLVNYDKLQGLKFNSNDSKSSFKLWKFKFQTLTKSLSIEEAFTAECKDEVKKIRLKSLLLFNLDDQTLQLITTSTLEKEPYVIWSALLKLYESDSTTSRIATKGTFLKLKMNKEEDMRSYISRLLNLCDQLSGMNETPSEA